MHRIMAARPSPRRIIATIAMAVVTTTIIILSSHTMEGATAMGALTVMVMAAATHRIQHRRDITTIPGVRPDPTMGIPLRPIIHHTIRKHRRTHLTRTSTPRGVAITMRTHRHSMDGVVQDPTMSMIGTIITIMIPITIPA